MNQHLPGYGTPTAMTKTWNIVIMTIRISCSDHMHKAACHVSRTLKTKLRKACLLWKQPICMLLLQLLQQQTRLILLLLLLQLQQRLLMLLLQVCLMLQVCLLLQLCLQWLLLLLLLPLLLLQLSKVLLQMRALM